MDDSGGSRYEGLIATVRKKRSPTLRLPRTENAIFPEHHDHSPLTSLPYNDGRVSSDEYTNDANAEGRIHDLNSSISRDSSANRFKGDNASKKNKEDGGSSATLNNARQGDDTNPRHGASLRQLGNAGDGVANDSRLKQIKLKVGGATRIIQTKNSSCGSSGNLLSSKSAQPSDSSKPQQNLTPQDSVSEDGPLADKKSGSNRTSCEDLSGGTFDASKSGMEKMPMKNVFEKQGDKPHQNRKSQKVPRRLVLDQLDEDEEDEQIHNLEKLNLGKESTKTRSFSEGMKVDKSEMLEDVGRSGKEVKRISNQGSEYTEYDKKEPLSDGEAKRTNKKEKQMKESSETPVETKSEISRTSRQWAVLSKRDFSTTSMNQIEFSNGLPPLPPRKQKEKLSEVEKQVKRREAAQRRRIQHEKAARELEAEAIGKIRGQDSTRKKREEQIKKQQEELAQASKELAPNTIRTVMGPTGTTVTFSHDLGLPSIFDSKPCSYPSPREKCAGPSCDNPYKYRDSKTNLPLCSLKCYKAIHEKMQGENAS